jgi:hypothetical protein
MNRVYGPRPALDPWWTRDYGVARPLYSSGGSRDSLERERERESMSLGFSPLTPLGDGATKMAT